MCVKVLEAIKLAFWVVSGVGPGIGVLDGVYIPQGKGEVWNGLMVLWFEWRF